MKALTVWQPWASLIMAGAKPYEFRGWRAPRSIVGQRIVIHAAAKTIERADVNYLIGVLLKAAQPEYADLAAETCLVANKAIPVLARALGLTIADPLPLAAGLGTAVLGAPRNGLDIAAEFGVPRANDSDRDEHANWGWPLTDIEVWPAQIPMRGAQGFWNWPEPADALLLGPHGA